jgi:hypothetical protein
VFFTFQQSVLLACFLLPAAVLNVLAKADWVSIPTINSEKQFNVMWLPFQ